MNTAFFSWVYVFVMVRPQSRAFHINCSLTGACAVFDSGWLMFYLWIETCQQTVTILLASQTFFWVHWYSETNCFIPSVGEESNVHRFIFLFHRGLNLIPLGWMWLVWTPLLCSHPASYPRSCLVYKVHLPWSVLYRHFQFLLENQPFLLTPGILLPLCPTSSIPFPLAASIFSPGNFFSLLSSSYCHFFAFSRSPSQWVLILLFSSPYLI